MRILIVLPQQSEASGNEVTAARHRAGLLARGDQVELVRVVPGDAETLRRAVSIFAPDLVHLLHAYRSGAPWLEAGLPSIPYLVTLTGTDINHGLTTPNEGPIIRRVLQGAARIVALNVQTVQRLQDEIPALSGKIAFLPPGISLGSAPSPVKRAAMAPPGCVLFLHPAGIRPVKGNRELLDLCDPLLDAGLPLRVAFCGPLLDADYGSDFLAAVALRPWAHYLGIIPSAAMPATLRLADVVLNNSQSEGLPNALLEAAALGVPMLVREIPGNTAIVEAKVNGLLYHDASSFFRAARSLIEDPLQRSRLSLPRPERFSPEVETAALAALYGEVLARDASP